MPAPPRPATTGERRRRPPNPAPCIEASSPVCPRIAEGLKYKHHRRYAPVLGFRPFGAHQLRRSAPAARASSPLGDFARRELGLDCRGTTDHVLAQRAPGRPVGSSQRAGASSGFGTWVNAGTETSSWRRRATRSASCGLRRIRCRWSCGCTRCIRRPGRPGRRAADVPRLGKPAACWFRRCR